MSQDSSLQRNRDSPDHPHDDDRDRHFDKIASQSAFTHKEGLREELQLPVLHADIEKYDQELHYPGGQGSDRGAADSHLRKPEVTENQCVVDYCIDNQRDHGDIEGYFHRSHTAKRRHQDAGEDEQREGEKNDLHIPGSLLDNCRISGKKSQDPGRKQRTGNREKQSYSQSQFQGQARDFADRGHSSLPVILGGQNNKRITDSDRQLLHQEENLVHCRSAGKSRLRIAAHHDVVDHVDTVSHQVLQSHHDKD